MKITVERSKPTDIQPKQQPDLTQKPTFPKRTPRRKIRASGAGIRFKRDPGAPYAKRSSRPETPLLNWKFDEAKERNDLVVDDEKWPGGGGRRSGRKVRDVVSCRKLGADLWRLHLPELRSSGGQRLGIQPEGAHIRAPVHGHHVDGVHNSPARDLVHSPHSASVLRNGLQFKHGPSVLFSNSAMEGATKWDPIVRNQLLDESKQIFGQSKLPKQQVSPAITALEKDLEQAKSRINDLESERRSSKKKLEQFLQKLSEERSAWRRREHEKIRSVIDDMQVELKRDKKNRQRLELVNSKLINDLADAKLTAKRYAQEYEKERKARELIEEVCDELAKEIGEDKAEVEAMKRESMKFRDEVEEERKMLQMAEVWREERVQMKLIDAKVMLEEKYSQMNHLIAELDLFINSKRKSSDLEDSKKAEFLKQVASSFNIQDVREMTYEPPNPDDIYSVFEDVNFGGSNEREVEQSGEYSPESHASKISPEVKMPQNESSRRNSNVFMDRSGEFEEDASEWETVSHPDDQGSSYSRDESDPSVNNKNLRLDWERSGGGETPIVEISEVEPKQTRQLKKVTSISRLWKSSNGENYKILSVDGMNGRLSSGGIMLSPDGGSGKGGFSPHDMAGQWSSPDSGHRHIGRGMKGCIEWPKTGQRNSLKSRLMEAKMEGQKVQLRQVLKQKC